MVLGKEDIAKEAEYFTSADGRIWMGRIRRYEWIWDKILH